MTKFEKAEKTRLSGLRNRNIRFCQFQNKITEEAKFEDLNIQEYLKCEKGKGRHHGVNPCVDDQI
jgi:hypothetical protein